MLTPGNKKLGKYLIWGFGLPSGRADVCVGMTPACRRVCYAVRTEQYRPRAARQYERNLRLTKKRSFVRRVRAFLIAHHVRVVRIHTGGEFFSVRYARKWLSIVQRSPKVRFFTYTRSWRVPMIREVLTEMAAEPNLQLWFSADKETSLPEVLPEGVRVAWLMTSLDDQPPQPVDLVFRTQALRRTPLTTIQESPVCPAEDGTSRLHTITCDQCRTCWRPSTLTPSPRTRHSQPLPLITEVPC